MEAQRNQASSIQKSLKRNGASASKEEVEKLKTRRDQNSVIGRRFRMKPKKHWNEYVKSERKKPWSVPDGVRSQWG
jgi:hypothetical protein